MVFSRSAPAPQSSEPQGLAGSTGGAPEVPSLCWGAQTLTERGTIQPFRLVEGQPAPYNAIGTHRGTGWRGNLVDTALEHLSNRQPSSGCKDAQQPWQASMDWIIPHTDWFGENVPVSFDPFGAAPSNTETPPSISITPAQLRWLALSHALEHGWLEADGEILEATGQLNVTRIEISAVWYLPGMANRLQVEEAQLRQALYQATDGLFPDLITRPEVTVFLPPLPPTVVDILGSAQALRRGQGPLTVHIDNQREASVSDDTTQAGWIQALEACIETAQFGGVGVMVGLAPCTVPDRSPIAAPGSGLGWQLAVVLDVLRWLGVSRIDQFLSLNYDDSDQLTRAGIEIVQQVVTAADGEFPASASDWHYTGLERAGR